MNEIRHEFKVAEVAERAAVRDMKNAISNDIINSRPSKQSFARTKPGHNEQSPAQTKANLSA